jgi:hypothetical protein
MAELRFSRRDIRGLAERLSEILTDLSEKERLLLLVILELAAEHAYQPVTAPDTIEVEELLEQIILSFVPDDEQEFVLHVKKPPPKIGGKPKETPRA